MDLSFPPDRSVNSAIPLNSYLDSPFKLRLPGIDRLCELILSKGRRGCGLMFQNKKYAERKYTLFYFIRLYLIRIWKLKFAKL